MSCRLLLNYTFTSLYVYTTVGESGSDLKLGLVSVGLQRTCGQRRRISGCAGTLRVQRARREDHPAWVERSGFRNTRTQGKFGLFWGAFFNVKECFYSREIKLELNLGLVSVDHQRTCGQRRRISGCAGTLRVQRARREDHPAWVERSGFRNTRTQGKFGSLLSIVESENSLSSLGHTTAPRSVKHRWSPTTIWGNNIKVTIIDKIVRIMHPFIYHYTLL